MTIVAGKIAIELELDDKGVPIAIKRVGGNLNELQGTLNRTAASVKRLEDAQLSLSTKFRHLVMTLGNLRFVAMDINDVFLRLPGAILKSAGELERTRALLSGLSKELTAVGRAAEGASNFNYITKLAQRAPFEIAALSDAFVKLKSAGLDPAGGSMQALVDSVARFGGTGETLKRASIAIQQMLGKGVVSMEELRQQLGEAVPTAMQDMATGMGMTMGALTEAVSKGTVEASSAINKMLVIMSLRNRGAAEEMMQTWVGMQAQLKTRLQLAAEEVAGAGFGDAMKQVARDLSDALNSVEFKRFNDQFGAGLGEAVTTLSNFARMLMQHADLIKGAALAWLSYKAASVAITPALKGLQEHALSIQGTYRNQAQRVLDLANSERAAAALRAQAAGEAARAQQAASAEAIAAMQRELAFRQAMVTQARAEMAKLAATMPAVGGSGRVPAGSPGAGQFVSQAATQAQIRDISRVEAAHLAASATIQRELAAQRAANAAAAASVMAHGNQVDALSTSMTRAAGGMSRMGVAAGMAGAAFRALGGWTTALNLAIMAGIAIWMNWGKAAEEAAARADRARKGLSDAKDMADAAVAEAEAKRRRDTAARALKFAEDGGWASGTNAQRAEYERLKVAYANADAQVTTLVQESALHRKNVTREASRTWAESEVRQVDDVLQAIRTGSQKKIASIDDTFNAEMKAAGDSVAKQKDAAKKRGEAMRDLAKSEAQQKVAGLNAALDTLKKGFDGPKGEEAKLAASMLREKLDQANGELAMAINAQGENKFIIPDKKDKGAGAAPAVNRIQELIENVREKRAQLDAEVRGLVGASSQMDEAAGLIDKIHQQWKDGDFKWGKGKKQNATLAEVTTYTQAQVDLRNAEQLAKDMRDLSDMTKSIAPDYQEAMAILMDPLGKSKRGAKENQLDQFLAKMESGRVEAALEGLGTSLSELRNKAQAIDMVDTFQKMEEETKRLNDSLVNDSREAAVAKIAAQNAEHANFVNNLIERRRLAGASEQELARLQQMAEANATARAAQLAEKAKSPMQKLADEWANSTRNMEEATARWAGSTLDAFATTVMTGKADWAGLVKSILMDTAKIQAQQMLAPALKGAGDAATNGLKSLLGLGGGDAATVVADNARELARMNEAARMAREGLGAMTEDGVKAATASLVNGLTAKGQETLVTGQFTSSMSMATSAVYNFVSALQASSATGGGGSGLLGSLISAGISAFLPGAGPIGGGVDYSLASGASSGLGLKMPKFANGGIMTALGSMPLKKYAAGGIARSPQMAIFGEGDMAEAYVPLPDGRSIPVTLRGGGAAAAEPPQVTVNVINQSGQPVAAQQGQTRFDGKQMILDVVLSAASQPGHFRDGMKGALR